MTRPMRYGFVAALSFCLLPAAGSAMPQAQKKPLDATTLLALVAGNALPENIVAILGTRGLAFTPTEGYKTQLSTAGATAEVLRAVNKATVRPGAEEEHPMQEIDGRQHLALAGNLIRNNQYEGAKKEVAAAFRVSGRKPAAGFVMAELLRRREEWVVGATVLEEVARYEPDFPELRTKLSFLLYRAGQDEDSLREAKAALQDNPNSAEAHKNAALALEDMKKFDAAEQEYREALRLKPDYENVHYDLGILLYDKNDLDGAIVEYKKALALNPSDVDAHFNLACVFQNKMEYDSAIRELLEAKKLDPQNPDVRRNLEVVKKRLQELEQQSAGVN